MEPPRRAEGKTGEAIPQGVGDAHWRAVKDALYDLLIHRGRELPRVALGDGADRRLAQRLGRLRPTDETRPWMRGALLDVGYDLGRHIYSKRLLLDELSPALASLGQHIQASGFGAFHSMEVFHRHARLDLEPAAGLGDEDLTRCFLGGLVQGALEEAFNSPVRLDFEGPRTLLIRLGKGRDVNVEDT